MINYSKLAIVFSFSCSLLFSNSVTAQLAPDRTLGSESTRVRRNVNIRGYNSDLGEIREAVRIDGGAIRGKNLFHSFREFNVGRGRGVYFTNPTGVENILTRVTGRNPSNILGRLGVLGGANLFLINPNGILFGKDATLDLRGSFYATTADGIKLGENGVFSASDPPNSNLLTVQPGALFHNAMRNYLATIENRGNLSAQGNLFLSADRLNLQGQLFAGENLILQARETLKIGDSLTQAFIATARENLIVEGQETLNILALNHPRSGLFSGGDMVLRSANTIVGDGYYWSGGNFSIEQLDRSFGNWSSIKDPIIRSIGDVVFNEYTGGSLQIIAGGSVNVPGIITIVSPEPFTSIPTQVTLSDGTEISLDRSTRPTVDIRAGVDPNQIDFNVPISNNLLAQIITSDRATSADINIGGIVMLGENAANGTVLLTNQYRPLLSLPGGDIRVGAIITTDRLSEVLSQPQLSKVFQLPPGVNPDFNGDGGDVIIDSRNSIQSLLNPISRQKFSFINTSSASGNSGDITLLAKDNISATNSFILGDTFGAGQSGNITIKASSIELIDSTVASNIRESGAGNGGNISIYTEKLRLNGNTFISTANFSANENSIGGDITISATELLEFIGTQKNPGQTIAEGVQKGDFSLSDISSFITTVTSDNGLGGDLTINAGKLIAQRAIISTGTLNGGNGGKLNVNATEKIELINAVLFSPAARAGNAQDATINTRKLIVRDGSQITTNTFGDGNAGDMFITATESVELSSSLVNNLFPSGLFASTIGGTGDAGNIIINTGRLIVQDGTSINTLTGSLSQDTIFELSNIGGQAGNIVIDARESVVLSGSTKISGARDSLARPSIITASTSSKYPGGNIQITTGKFILQGGAQVSTASFFTGNPGELRIIADEIDLTGAEVRLLPDYIQSSGLFALAAETSTSTGSTIILDSQSIIIRDGARIAVDSQGSGIAGNINLTSDSLTLDRRGTISAETNSDRGGNITIDLGDRLILRRNSIISTTAGLEGGRGNGGNVTINTPSIVAFPRNNQIISKAFEGNGGKINISTNAILGYPQYLTIDASSQRGIDGTITFNNLETDLNSNLTELSENVINTENIIASSCLRRSRAKKSTFIVSGAGGLPQRPNSLYISDFPTGEVRSIPISTDALEPSIDKKAVVVVSKKPENEPVVIRQARGWIKKPDGTIVLTAYPTEGTSPSPSVNRSDCSTN